MEWLGAYHPQIVHTPVALLVFSAFFALLGLLFDRDWVRKASVLLLVFGLAGAQLAVMSGRIAHRVPEHKQGVPEKEIDEHAEHGQQTVWIALAALVVIVLRTRLTGRAAAIAATLAVLLQIGAAVSVSITGYRGGKLVYDYGANVKLGGQLVKNPGAVEKPDEPGER